MPRYFDAWLERTKKAEQERLRSRGKGEGPATFAGFGARAEAAWEQWMEYVLEINDEVVGDDEERADEDEDD